MAHPVLLGGFVTETVYLQAHEFDALDEYSMSIPTLAGCTRERALAKRWKCAWGKRWLLGRFVPDPDPTRPDWFTVEWRPLERLAEIVDPRPV